ncbi:MAG: hypothetical protein PHV37_01095 [Candidatus Gastranaerophilales bacterium]|nr:hypothetical protein [Candidatus Gastranaerophilales bacterium]
MTEDKNKNQKQSSSIEQSSTIDFSESRKLFEERINASEPKEGTQPIIRSRDDNNNQN